MGPFEKLKTVCEAAAVEDPEESRTARPQTCDNLPIYNAVVSGGKHILLLKSLLTSVCENNCAYCGIRWVVLFLSIIRMLPNRLLIQRIRFPPGLLSDHSCW
jgi:hypothetical protein